MFETQRYSISSKYYERGLDLSIEKDDILSFEIRISRVLYQ